MIDGKQIKNTSIRETKINIQDVLTMNNNRLVSLALPIDDYDGAPKRYVDAVAQGLLLKDACILATDTPSDVSSFNYNNSTGQWTNVTAPIFDSVALTDLDRVLIKDAADARGNGIWIFSESAHTFVRAEDADNLGDPTLSELRGGTFTFITSGTNNGDTGWTISSPNTEIVISTDNIIWSQFSGAGSIFAGDGLIKNGSTLHVNPDNSSIGISADQVRVIPGGITGDKLNSSVAGFGLELNGVSNELNVLVDDITIEIDTDTLQVKADGIGLTEIDSTIFGNGIIVSTDIALNIGNGFEFLTSALSATMNPNNSMEVTVDGFNSSTITEIYENPLDSAIGTPIGTPVSNFDTGIALPETPAGNSMILIYLNGIKDEISYGTKTATFWFEPVGGGDARLLVEIIATDELHFNPTLAGFDLETDDEIELVYNKIQ